MKKNIRFLSIALIIIVICGIIFFLFSSNTINSSLVTSSSNSEQEAVENSVSTAQRELSPDVAEYPLRSIEYDEIIEKTGIKPVFNKSFVINDETYNITASYLAPNALLVYNYKTENLTNKVMVSQKIHGYSETSYADFEVIKEGFSSSKDITLSNGTIVNFFGDDENTKYIYWEDEHCFYLLEFDYSEPFAELQKFLEDAVCNHDLDVDV